MNNFKYFNSLHLKIFAMVFMLCDHLWASLIPGNLWLTNIGRLAFPVFAFQIVEGYRHTHDLNAYIKRLFFFALLSEIPFNLMYGGNIFFPFHQNVLFTFCIALLFLKWMDRMKKRGRFLFIVSVICSCILGFFIGTVTMCDYFGYGVLMVFVFYLFDDSFYGWLGRIAAMIWINGYLMSGLTIPFTIFGHSFNFPQQAFAVFSLFFIFMYNGRPGRQDRMIRLLCYSFYPVHMLILALIWLFIVN